MDHVVQDRKAWLEKAKKKGARYLIIAHDTFDMGDYPIYVMATEKFWEQMPRKFGVMNGKDDLSDQTHEVYDLEMDINMQLQEQRAWHPPEKA